LPRSDPEPSPCLSSDSFSASSASACSAG
jgi:hypothetical protein